jgi:type II secretory pathway component GspD/PulD (secretin)
MRTRISLLTAIVAMLAAARTVPAQTAAQTNPTPYTPPQASSGGTPPASVVPASGTDVEVKDISNGNASPAKSKDAEGNETLSVDFPDEEIRNILRNVAELFDLNLVIPDSLQGKTSVKLHDVTWHQIFQVVLSPVGYTYIEDGNIIKIVSNESLTQEPVSTEIFVINYAKAADIMPTLASLVDAAAGGKIVIDTRTNSLVITERPSRMKRIRPVIDQLDRPTDQVMIESKFVEISNNDIKNIGINWSSLSAFHVTATPGTSGIYTYANTYGANTNATVVGTNNTNGSTAVSTTGTGSTGSNSATTVSSVNGVVTSSPTTGTNATLSNNQNTNGNNGTSTSTTYNLNNGVTGVASNAISAVFSSDQFALVLSALEQMNNAKIVSNPTIVTLNNTEASINVGQQYPIPQYSFNQQTGTFQVDGFSYKDIGIILKVTPQVNARGFIKLTLAPEVSQNQGTTSFGGASGASIPIIGSRKAVTQVSLKDGYTMGIGGLISTNFNKGVNKVPFLGSIPIIGYLFKQDNTTDTVDNLVIFITAKTISAEGAPVEQVFNSQEVRNFQLKRSDMPGYRDGSDPFINESPKPNTRGN